MSVTKIDDNLFLAGPADNKTMVAFSASKDGDACRVKDGKLIGPGANKVNGLVAPRFFDQSTNVAKWGKNNDLPDMLLRIIYCDKDAPHLLRTIYRFVRGKEICRYREEFDEDAVKEELKKKEVVVDDEDWKTFKRKHRWIIEKYLRARAMNLTVLRNAFTEVLLERGENYPETWGKIASFRNIDGPFIRALCNDNGEIYAYRVYSKPKSGKVYYEDIPPWDPENPRANGKFIIHTCDHTIGEGVYAIPDWIGAIGDLKIRQLIKLHHLNGLLHGYHIGRKCNIPMQVLEAKYLAQKNDKNPKTRQQIRAELIAEVDTQLSGPKGNNKTLWLDYFYDEKGNKIEIEIEPIDNSINDAQYLKLAEFAQSNNSASFGVANALAGVEVQGKLGGNAGEIRNHLNFHTSWKAYDDRLLFLYDLEVFAYIENWDDDLKFKVIDHPQPVTTDIKRSGKLEA